MKWRRQANAPSPPPKTGEQSGQTEEIISRHTLFWLLITNLAVLSPLLSKTTLWTVGICGICFVWRVGIYLGQVAKPPRYLVTLLAIGSAATLALVANQIGILNALINLLVLGYALKYIEMRNRRDVRAVVVVGYFLIALTFIEYQSLLSTLHLLLVTIINTCVLLSLYQSRSREQQDRPFRRTAFMGAKLVLQSLPFAILLFLVLPRFAPLWLVPSQSSAQTGLSDAINFGDIERLTRSADLAFRATFISAMPSNAQLYWRALVLEDYDGKTWRRNKGIEEVERNAFLFQPKRQQTAGATYDYQVIAEPSSQHWLFGLDQAFTDTRGVVELPDQRLYSIRSIDQRFQYDVSSVIDAPLEPTISSATRQVNVTLPENKNPRTFALAQQFLTQHPEPKIRLNAMMRYFTQEPYFYTLTPPPVGPQQIDDFLFENKAGFCVHYASAFAFMARATGLPARLVTGYQGGEYNPNAKYISIYQYMAHAWVEVWIAGEGWRRYDPTAMIAPERIEEGFDATFSSSDSYLLDNPLSSLRFKSIPWLNQLRWQLASIDYYWSVWVLGFNNERQNQVLQKLLGEVTSTKIALFMLSTIGIIGFGIAYSAGLFSFERHHDKIQSRYQAIIQRLVSQGLDWQVSFGPQTLAQQVQLQFPTISDEFDKFIDYYLALTYQNIEGQRRKKYETLYFKKYRHLRGLILKHQLNRKVF